MSASFVSRIALKCVGMIGRAFAGCLGYRDTALSRIMWVDQHWSAAISEASLSVLVSRRDNSEKQNSPQAAVAFVITEKPFDLSPLAVCNQHAASSKLALQLFTVGTGAIGQAQLQVGRASADCQTI